MTRPTSYDLLTVIHQEVKDLRVEIKGEIKTVQENREEDQKRIGDLEKFQYNLMGKIGMGVLLVGGAVTFIMNIIYQFIVSRIR